MHYVFILNPKMAGSTTTVDKYVDDDDDGDGGIGGGTYCVNNCRWFSYIFTL